MQKIEQLAALAGKRKAASLNGFKNLSDFDPQCECNFVSPVTKSAGNIDSDILVFLQDLSSEDEMSGEVDPETARLGYTPSMPTFKNLIRLLHDHLGKVLDEVYATNLFPLIKPGGISAPIGPESMLWAAKEFGIPHIEILKPRLVIALGGATFDALSSAVKNPIRPTMGAAIAAPFDFKTSRIWCQAHTGGFGTAKRGGKGRVDDDWRTMAAWYKGISPVP